VNHGEADFGDETGRKEGIPAVSAAAFIVTAVSPLLARTAGQACRQTHVVWSIDGLRVRGLCAIGRRANDAGLHRVE
jgi:hypothetical protein